MIQLHAKLTKRIAPEIYDMIIEHLCSSKSALMACSTVSKSWFTACRHHLFEDVSLDPQFVEFLFSSTHAMETIAPCIRNVVLGGAWVQAHKDELARVCVFLLELDGIRGLSVTSWNRNMLSEASLKLPPGNSVQNITRLHLRCIQFSSLYTLATFIGTFPTLENLIFDNVTLDQDSSSTCSLVNDSARQPPCRPLRLKKLQIIQPSIVGPILHWFFDNDQPRKSQSLLTPFIEELILPDIFLDETRVVGLVLRALGSSLRHLEVGFLTYSENVDVSKTLPSLMNLSYNTNLQTLHVHHLTLYRFPPLKRAQATLTNLDDVDRFEPSSQFSWLAPFLDNVSSKIAELGFHIWLSDREHLNSVNWLSLNDIFSRPRFGGLKLMKFQVIGLGGRGDDLKTWLLVRLPIFKASQVTLQISSYEL